MRFTRHNLAMAILQAYSENKGNSKNRFNVLGKPYQQGSLERVLHTQFTDEERAIAGDVLMDLQTGGLIRPTYADITAPGDWLVITPKGEQALINQTIDRLDELLQGLNSPYDLLSMRRGMHDALLVKNTDWQRHVATSGRELITKVLHTIAPDDLVKSQPGFQPNNPSQNGITRKQRIIYYLSSMQDHVSDRDISIIKKAQDLIEECYAKFSAITHTDKKEVEHLVKLTEVTMMFILDR